MFFRCTTSDGSIGLGLRISLNSSHLNEVRKREKKIKLLCCTYVHIYDQSNNKHDSNSSKVFFRMEQ